MGLGVLVGEFEVVEGEGVFEGGGGEVFVAGYVEAGAGGVGWGWVEEGWGCE